MPQGALSEYNTNVNAPEFRKMPDDEFNKKN